jgi:hypothetical protein
LLSGETTQIEQPSLFKMPLQMLSPKPIPLGLRDAPLSSLAKGLNRCLTSYCFIPIPESITVMNICLYSLLYLQTTFMNPILVNLLALVKRFNSTYWSLLLSDKMNCGMSSPKYTCNSFWRKIALSLMMLTTSWIDLKMSNLSTLISN